MSCDWLVQFDAAALEVRSAAEAVCREQAVTSRMFAGSGRQSAREPRSSKAGFAFKADVGNRPPRLSRRVGELAPLDTLPNYMT